MQVWLWTLGSALKIIGLCRLRDDKLQLQEYKLTKFNKNRGGETHFYSLTFMQE